jgi:glycosyltransferase involved in cell wall biosynthesis
LQDRQTPFVAEALACGKPVLTTDKVATWREVEAYNAGFVDTDDLAGVTRLLDRFIELRPRERSETGGRAREAYIERFDIGTMDPQLIEILRSR